MTTVAAWLLSTSCQAAEQVPGQRPLSALPAASSALTASSPSAASSHQRRVPWQVCDPELISEKTSRADNNLSKTEVVNAGITPAAHAMNSMLISARELSEARKYSDSNAILSQILIKDPKNTEVLGLQASNLWKLGALDQAISSLERALDIDPSFLQLRNNLGCVLYDMHRFDQAVTAWRQILSQKSDLPEMYYNIGTALFQSGSYRQSAESLSECVRLSPGDARAHNNLGLALFKLGQTDEAESSWRKAIELQPDLAATHINLGKALMQERRQPTPEIHESR